MVPSNLEIYPYSKNNIIKNKKLRLQKINVNEELHNFTHNKYLELFNDNANIDNIIINILEKLITITNSQDGFIAFIEDENKLTFKYHCIQTDSSNSSLKAQHINCPVELKSGSLLTKSITSKIAVISNDVKNDPRSNKKNMPKNHMIITTFCGIPLIYNDIVLGQIGLSNAKKYRKKNIYEIIPIQKFLCNFVHLLNQQRLHNTKTLEMRKEVNILKDSFIATMSHEIRTPLNGIVGMASLLKEATNLSIKQQEYLHILLECSSQLMELVNDILDYSKIASGGLVLINQNFNLKSCVYKVRDIVIDRATVKGLEFKISISPNLPENLIGDSKRIKQILFNLITNAIKFTEKGSIELIIDVQDINDNTDIKKKMVYFKVIDTGIGIKPADQEKIFQVFTKINKDDSFYTNTTPGVGMGLAITKFLVEKMGGTIKLESNGFNGSTFSFNIILEDETNIKQLVELHETELKNKSVLVVDDNEDNRLFLMDALFSWGIKPILFSSARECLNYINKYPLIDAAIIDLCMPNMSGLELAQALRERGYKNPIIGLSSIGSDIIGKDWFDYFQVKPISKSVLFNILLRCFFTSNRDKKPKLIKQSVNNNFKIIVAEDDHFNQVLMREILETIGYNNIKIVSNGELCVNEIKQNPYDICLMDVKMPVMDGLQATRIIKKMNNPPIIIGVSASVLEADRNKCFSAGMDGYVPKPIQKQQLESLLKSLELRVFN
jgi:signal transduction histidine kinase/DNA-binding response OmpR family regulator